MKQASFYIFKIYPKALNVFITIITSVVCGIELIQWKIEYEKMILIP